MKDLQRSEWPRLIGVRVTIWKAGKFIRTGVVEIAAASGATAWIAADGVEAIQAVRQHHPDVVVMDVSMPQMSGIQAAVEIRTQSPTTLIMLISANRLSEREVRETGARGSLSKCALNRVTDGINAMLRGEEFYAMTAAPDRDD